MFLCVLCYFYPILGDIKYFMLLWKPPTFQKVQKLNLFFFSLIERVLCYSTVILSMWLYGMSENKKVCSKTYDVKIFALFSTIQVFVFPHFFFSYFERNMVKVFVMFSYAWEVFQEFFNQIVKYFLTSWVSCEFIKKFFSGHVGCLECVSIVV